ncbi:hypothetical protein E2320_008167 [Naja naja]|nr:hypothetical protein E2320_008167 [Naja naja]
MQSSDFEENFNFLFPGVENVENPLPFWIQCFPEDLSQGVSQNDGWKSIQPENTTFDIELGFQKELHFHIRDFPEELSQGICQSSDQERQLWMQRSVYENDFNLMFPRLEKVENLLLFWS